MIYAMSDLHGCFDKFAKMLEKIKFGDDDTLYILGDIVDRGADGIKILQEAMKRKNITVLQGNHDFLAHYILKSLTAGARDLKSEDFTQAYRSWILDGGAKTEEAFFALDAEEQRKILLYINYMPFFDEISVGGKTFFLSHTLPEKARMQEFDKLLWQEFIIGEPEYEKEYFPDKIVVSGHTPTGFIDPDYTGKIWRKNNHIALDCGAVFGNPLGCICLDTMEEFYVI